MPAPGLDDNLSVSKAREPILVETFAAKPTIERFDVRILIRLARLDQPQCDLSFVCQANIARPQNSLPLSVRKTRANSSSAWSSTRSPCERDERGANRTASASPGRSLTAGFGWQRLGSYAAPARHGDYEEPFPRVKSLESEVSSPLRESAPACGPVGQAVDSGSKSER